MKSPMAVLMLVAFCAQGGMLEMTVSDVDAEPSCVTTVVETNEPAPRAGSDELTLMPGWPVKVPYAAYSPSRGVATADFDGDGRLEIVMPTGDGKVHVWKYDGSYYPGWPVTIGVDSCQYAVSIADVDLDGEYEIAVGTRGLSVGNGPIYLFDENGNVKPGWPYNGIANGMFNSAPTLADIDGDDTLEIICQERAWPNGYVHVVRHDGTPYSPAWPCTLDHVPAAGNAVGDINLDGVMDIVAISYNSMYVFQPDGSLLPGWPVTMPNGRNWSYQSPALADIDGDDTLEIITAMHKDGGGCYVFRHDGTVQPDWPYVFPRWSYCPPTVADLYRDGDLKVVCGLAGSIGSLNVLYAMDDDASVLAGFPYWMSGGAECNMTVADIDGDDDMEILFTSNMITSADSLGYIYAVHHDGSAVSGFPLRPWGFTYLNGPNVADVDGDDSLDIIAVSAYAGQMHVTVWETGVPFNRMSWEWPTYQFNMQRTGLYERAQTGIEEGRTPDASRFTPESPYPTIVHGVLRMPETGIRHSAYVLLNSTGRRVLELSPGANNVRHLASGVYFLRPDAEAGGSAGKLIIRN